MHALAADLDRLGVEIDTRSPVWITDWAWPLERRTIA